MCEILIDQVEYALKVWYRWVYLLIESVEPRRIWMKVVGRLKELKYFTINMYYIYSKSYNIKRMPIVQLKPHLKLLG